jgi:hypothetical protein
VLSAQSMCVMQIIYADCPTFDSYQRKIGEIDHFSKVRRFCFCNTIRHYFRAYDITNEAIDSAKSGISCLALQVELVVFACDLRNELRPVYARVSGLRAS